MLLSVVTSLYRSEAFIAEFVERIEKEASTISDHYEIIMVNDGCPGQSLEVALNLLEEHPNIKIIELSRNFGHHTAVFAGLEAAKGELVFVIDCDLEESPEWLSTFKAVMDREHADLVFGVQSKRKAGFKQGISESFYSVFNALSETKIPRNVCTARLMSKKFKDAIVSMRERNLFLAGIYAWAGFKQVEVPVEKNLRASKSNYSPVRMLKLLINAVTSFSAFPLYLSFFTGLLLSSLAGIYGIFLVARKLLIPDTIVTGYVSLLTSIFFVGGLTILMMGVIGIYLSKMFIELKQRPQYLVRNVYGAEHTVSGKSQIS